MEAAELYHAARVRTHERRSIAEAARAISYSIQSLPPGDTAFDPALVIDWVRAQNLVTGEPDLLPRSLFCTDYRAERRVYRSPFRRTTNGLGAGRSLEAATLHALYEVIERDCIGRSRPEPLASQGIPEVAAGLRDTIRAAGLEIGLWALPNRYKLPCVKARLIEPGTGAAFTGSACAGSPDCALLGAMTEAVQSRLTVITGSRDDLADRHYRGCAADPHVAPGKTSAERTFETLPALTSLAPGSELEQLVHRVHRVSGVAALRVDLTLPEIGVPVVYVAAPGMQFDTRWH
jgi:ribosomal protein S12 methylthiotransferase accessory factor